MYEIKNLNIWKEISHNLFGCRCKVLSMDVSLWKGDKYE